MVSREQGEEKAKEASESAIYKIEVPANRFGYGVCGGDRKLYMCVPKMPNPRTLYTCMHMLYIYEVGG